MDSVAEQLRIQAIKLDRAHGGGGRQRPVSSRPISTPRLGLADAAAAAGTSSSVSYTPVLSSAREALRTLGPSRQRRTLLCQGAGSVARHVGANCPRVVSAQRIQR